MKLRTALLVSALTLTPVVSFAAPAQATSGGPYQIRISGPAEILDSVPLPPGAPAFSRTQLRVPIKVRCPAGETAHVPFAGLPIFFPPPDIRAVPSLPGMTAPTRVTCTGKWVAAYANASSIFRLQNPATDPFRRFTPGSCLVATVTITGHPEATVTESVRVRRHLVPV